LRDYFHAKDENRPHLLEGVFASEAQLEVNNHTGTISFPTVTEGREAIADILVRQFAQTYENIYSFYMDRPVEAIVATFSCDWLVGMSEKEGKNVRIGCGRYDWSFQAGPPFLTNRLVITIAVMEVLPPSQLKPVLTWLLGLDYPWTTAAAVRAAAPGIADLVPVLRYLEKGGLS
jgi:hypothetical protein